MDLAKAYRASSQARVIHTGGEGFAQTIARTGEMFRSRPRASCHRQPDRSSPVSLRLARLIAGPLIYFSSWVITLTLRSRLSQANSSPRSSAWLELA